MKLFKSIYALPNSDTELLHIYNALDCCITLEVFNAIEPQLDEVTRHSYDFSLALQGPILEMECRGVLVDLDNRDTALKLYEDRVALVESSLKEILRDGIGIEFNWNSPKQLQEFFYITMGLQVRRNKGKVSADRKALEKMRGNFYAEPIVNHILAIRDLKKKIGVLKTGIDSDGRIRTSYNIAGTDTRRLSSYTSAFGSGTNLQNITGELRSIFVADRGKKLCYIDLEQAESRAVGAIVWNLFHDGAYLDVCESGDLHTTVCKLVWDHLPWTGDPRQDKKIAKAPFYRHFDYRDAAKRLGHGTNYYGKPPNMAQQTHIELPLVSEFQHKYFAAFPGIRRWHEWVKWKLNREGWITTFMGDRRWFFGRRWEEETLRAAIAFEPQSSVATILNKGLLRAWHMPNIELLLQVHDAIVFQYEERFENEIVPEVMRTLEIEVALLHDRTMKIPTEAFVGWNWAYASDINKDGLIGFTGNDKRERTKQPPANFMDRVF